MHAIYSLYECFPIVPILNDICHLNSQAFNYQSMDNHVFSYILKMNRHMPVYHRADPNSQSMKDFAREVLKNIEIIEELYLDDLEFQPDNDWINGTREVFFDLKSACRSFINS